MTTKFPNQLCYIITSATALLNPTCHVVVMGIGVLEDRAVVGVKENDHPCQHYPEVVIMAYAPHPHHLVMGAALVTCHGARRGACAVGYDPCVLVVGVVYVLAVMAAAVRWVRASFWASMQIEHCVTHDRYRS